MEINKNKDSRNELEKIEEQDHKLGKLGKPKTEKD